MKIEPVVLERVRFAAQQQVGAGVAESVQIEKFEEFVTSNLLYSLTATVLAEKIGGEQITRRETVRLGVTTPDGRLQRWKQRHWSKWWCRWACFGRPVRTLSFEKRETITLTVSVTDYATFPMSDYVPPPTMGPVVFHRAVSDFVSRDNL